MDDPQIPPGVTDASPATDPRSYVRDITLICMAFQVAPQQARLLSLLLVSRIVTPVIAYDDCGCNDICVAMHRLRQRIERQHGISIYSQRGVGYAFKAEMRQKAVNVLIAFATSSEFAFDVG